MSYNQPRKQFVKAKPLKDTKEKPAYNRDHKKNNKKYQQKQNQVARDPRQHIKLVLNQFKNYDKTPFIEQLCAKFPRYFSEKAQKPQQQNQANFAEFMWLGTRKQPTGKQLTKQMSSDSSDPNWQSDQQKQIKLVSKKIDENIISKINTINRKQPNKKLNDLQRHQKEFLQQYYRQRRVAQQQPNSSQVKVEKAEKKQKVEAEVKPVQASKKQQEDQWAEYDPNVGALITKGFIEKIQNGQQDDFDEDFSYQSQKGKQSSSSGEQDDDMFADQGPRKVVKTKQDKEQNDKKQHSHKQIVTINTHLFTQLAEQAGLQPQSCVWVISNKHQRYKVSTLYMNQYYKNTGLCGAFPFVSLNNSEFVHNQELQTQKALIKFKQQGERRRKNQNNFNKNNSNQRQHNSHYKQKK